MNKEPYFHVCNDLVLQEQQRHVVNGSHIISRTSLAETDLATISNLSQSDRTHLEIFGQLPDCLRETYKSYIQSKLRECLEEESSNLIINDTRCSSCMPILACTFVQVQSMSQVSQFNSKSCRLLLCRSYHIGLSDFVQFVTHRKQT